MVRYRIYSMDDKRYIDAIGKYVYVSVHFRGTSVNLQPEGGFLLGVEEYGIVDDDYQFKYDDFPEFRNDITAIKGNNIKDCIKCITDTSKVISYKDVIDMINDNSGSVLDEYDRWNKQADFYKYHRKITLCDKIYFDKTDNLCYIIMNYSKILEELNTINVFCKENNICQ